MKTLTDYARKGYRVFPVHGVTGIAGEHYCECGDPKCKAKKPYLSFKKYASNNVDKCSQWEASYDNCNIGLPTGKDNGFWVLDIDAKGGGKETMKRLAGDNRFPETPRAHTGGGGFHYYFLWDERAEALGISTQAGVFDGIDLRGEGGYVIAPPSKHLSGSSYNWITDAELGRIEVATAPDWLYELLEQAMKKDESKSQRNNERFKLQKVTSGEGRWNYLNDMACSLRAKYGYDANLLFTSLKALQDNRCEFGPGEEPYSDSELRRIADDIEKKISYVGKKLEDQFTLDDYGNSQRFINKHGSLVRWIPLGQKRSSGMWAVYDGKKWNTEPAAGAHVRTLGTQTIKAIPVDAESLQDKKEREAVLKWGARCLDNRYLDSMLERAKDSSDIAKPVDQFDTDLLKLNLQNGTLVMNGDKVALQDHSPDDYISKIAGTSYDEKATCPRWETFMEEIFKGDTEKIEYMQKVLGYSLTGSVSERLGWFLVGGGANGKSVLLEVMTHLLGDYGKKTNNKLLVADGSTDQLSLLSALMGTRFTYCSELDEGKKLSVAFFKEIIGGEEVEARRFYQDYIKFTPTFKLMLGTNNLPRIPEDSLGIWSRIRIVTFDETFYKEDEIDELVRKGKKKRSELKLRDDNLKDYFLDNELPGILNWCLEGYRNWVKDGLKDCTSVRDATNNYRSDEDVLGEWLDECCETAYTERERSRDLHTSFKDFTGIEMHPKTFKRYMTKKGLQNKNIGGTMYYIGIKLKNPVWSTSVGTQFLADLPN